MPNITMHGKDAVSAKLAECFVTINGNRYNFMQAIDLEAKFEKTKTEVPILGMSSLFGVTALFFRKKLIYTVFAIGVIVSLGYFSPIIEIGRAHV